MSVHGARSITIWISIDFHHHTTLARRLLIAWCWTIKFYAVHLPLAIDWLFHRKSLAKRERRVDSVSRSQTFTMLKLKVHNPEWVFKAKSNVKLPSKSLISLLWPRSCCDCELYLPVVKRKFGDCWHSGYVDYSNLEFHSVGLSRFGFFLLTAMFLLSFSMLLELVCGWTSVQQGSEGHETCESVKIAPR